MKATGILKLSNGTTYIINDFLPMIPIEIAREMYRKGELRISGSTKSMNSTLTAALKK